VRRLLGLALLLYIPHLAEEAFLGMHDDPIIRAALEPILTLSPRHAVYLMFQLMLLVTLVSTLLFASGVRGQTLVMSVLGIALLAESHHLIRACLTLHYNPGLLTSLPMPLFGIRVLRTLISQPETSLS
jgi:hypothetical protein